jgi:hypothetical protein
MSALACTAIIAVTQIARAQNQEPGIAHGERAPVAASAVHLLPANTPVPLQVDETLVSGVSAPGSMFRMRVTDDVRIDGEVVIPAGAIAFGEIVDSKKAGMLGKAGVLVLSARYVHLDQRDIHLHSALGASGESVITAALFVPFIRGKNATVEQGTRVVVRTASDERF